MSERLLTTREAAERLSLSPETILRRWRRGEIAGYRLAPNVLRFREQDLETWLEDHRTDAAQLTARGPR